MSEIELFFTSIADAGLKFFLRLLRYKNYFLIEVIWRSNVFFLFFFFIGPFAGQVSESCEPFTMGPDVVKIKSAMIVCIDSDPEVHVLINPVEIRS